MLGFQLVIALLQWLRENWNDLNDNSYYVALKNLQGVVYSNDLPYLKKGFYSCWN